MKKFWISAVVLVLVITCSLTLLSACREETDYDHTIVFYTTQGDELQSVTEKAIAEFETAHPGWKVEHYGSSSTGNYDVLRSQITKDIKNGNQPDLAYCYPDHVASYLSSKTVVDMNKYWDSEKKFEGVTLGFTDEEQDDFFDVFMEDGRADNFTNVQQYGYADDALLAIPFLKSTELMFYNKNALDALGLQPATTWEEMWTQCAKIKAQWPNVIPLAYDSEDNWFITICKQNGFGYTSNDPDEHYLWKNDTGLINYLQNLKTQYDKGYVITKYTLDATGNTYTNTLFTNGVGSPTDTGTGGGTVYCIGSSGGATYQDSNNKYKVGVAPIPGKDAQNVQAISQGPSLCMFRGGRGVSNPDEKEQMTWLFLKTLLKPEYLVQYSQKNGYNPCRQSSYTDVYVTNDDDEQVPYGEYLDSLANDPTAPITMRACAVARTMIDRFYTSPAFSGSSAAREVVRQVLVNVLNGDDPAAQLENAYYNCGGKN